ncbi:signal peptidase II [candidate division WOR-3 bacterium]|nr:signal peptidase II [candidate division WOR-3 bacterium]
MVELKGISRIQKDKNKNTGIIQSIKDRLSGMRWAKPRQWLMALIPASVVVVLDQVSKALVVAKLQFAGNVLWVIEPFFKLTYAQNEAGLFSLSYGPSWIYILTSSLAVAFVIVYLLRPQKSFVAVLLGFILGGGIGNLVDRIRVGYVIDWISMGIKSWRWGTYNVADASLVVSVILLLITWFFFSKSLEKKGSGEEGVSE